MVSTWQALVYINDELNRDKLRPDGPLGSYVGLLSYMYILAIPAETSKYQNCQMNRSCWWVSTGTCFKQTERQFSPGAISLKR